jgi:hypothetical protein
MIIETHIDPDNACLGDAAQRITSDTLNKYSLI